MNEPTEADRARAAFAQENAAGYHRQVWGWLGADCDRAHAVAAQRRAAHHAAIARSIMNIEEYPS